MKFCLPVGDNEFVSSLYQHYQCALGQVDVGQPVSFLEHVSGEGQVVQAGVYFFRKLYAELVPLFFLGNIELEPARHLRNTHPLNDK